MLRLAEPVGGNQRLRQLIGATVAASFTFKADMATKSYQTLQQEIEKLQSEAEAVRAAEVGGVISRIKEAIDSYNLQPEDLFGRGAQANAARKSQANRSKSGGAKYANEQGGEWGGRGPRPLWLREAIEAGHSLDEFLVK